MHCRKFWMESPVGEGSWMAARIDLSGVGKILKTLLFGLEGK
jgi:hypothetical protein